MSDKPMTNREALEQVLKEMKADGVDARTMSFVDILDYLSIVGVPGASYYYAVLIGGESDAKKNRNPHKNGDTKVAP